MQNEHVAKLNEIFSQANRVTRRDKALILGFMGGCRENPMPSPENYIVIKLGETEVNSVRIENLTADSIYTFYCSSGTGETRRRNIRTDVGRITYQIGLQYRRMEEIATFTPNRSVQCAK